MPRRVDETMPRFEEAIREPGPGILPEGLDSLPSTPDLFEDETRICRVSGKSELPRMPANPLPGEGARTREIP